jgi:hypothetical protein
MKLYSLTERAARASAAMAHTLLSLLAAFIFHVVPAYLTYSAAIAPTPATTRKWLAFWCVHTLLACCELLLDALAAHSLPYTAAKAALFAWLVLGGGAGVIYEGWLGGALRARSSDIDAALARLQAALASCSAHLLASGLQRLNPQHLLSAGLWAASSAAAAQQAAPSSSGVGAQQQELLSSGAGAQQQREREREREREPPATPAAAANVSSRRRGGGGGGARGLAAGSLDAPTPE